MARHFLAFRKEPNKFQELDTFQEVSSNCTGKDRSFHLQFCSESVLRLAWLLGEQ